MVYDVMNTCWSLSPDQFYGNYNAGQDHKTILPGVYLIEILTTTTDLTIYNPCGSVVAMTLDAKDKVYITDGVSFMVDTAALITRTANNDVSTGAVPAPGGGVVPGGNIANPG